MKHSTKTAMWFRLGEHERAIKHQQEQAEEIVSILTTINETVAQANTFIGDIGGLLVDLMADVSELAKRAGHRDIVERIDARAEIAGQMFALQHERDRETHAD